MKTRILDASAASWKRTWRLPVILRCLRNEISESPSLLIASATVSLKKKNIGGGWRRTNGTMRKGGVPLPSIPAAGSRSAESLALLISPSRERDNTESCGEGKKKKKKKKNKMK